MILGALFLWSPWWASRVSWWDRCLLSAKSLCGCDSYLNLSCCFRKLHIFFPGDSTSRLWEIREIAKLMSEILLSPPCKPHPPLKPLHRATKNAAAWKDKSRPHEKGCQWHPFFYSPLQLPSPGRTLLQALVETFSYFWSVSELCLRSTCVSIKCARFSSESSDGPPRTALNRA